MIYYQKPTDMYRCCVHTECHNWEPIIPRSEQGFICLSLNLFILCIQALPMQICCSVQRVRFSFKTH